MARSTGGSITTLEIRHAARQGFHWTLEGFNPEQKLITAALPIYF